MEKNTLIHFCMYLADKNIHRPRLDPTGAGIEDSQENLSEESSVFNHHPDWRVQSEIENLKVLRTLFLRHFQSSI